MDNDEEKLTNLTQKIIEIIKDEQPIVSLSVLSALTAMIIYSYTEDDLEGGSRWVRDFKSAVIRRIDYLRQNCQAEKIRKITLKME